ncbi:bZIP transcription factor 29 isoform X2 [Ricinus communis]|uniref:Uncharacterized protein n=1 Tax=Ricinus communis TaxID=3988 RepID=B9RM49_RICCO|nr:bZIP transcription factor 29 isoform X2 [Ricinus communis]EEF47372.1 conserved hypothetical protein [Ricinus communis]|eukprot:XP_002514818.1 transcription factor RF2b isoform X2 [Ricinus communis]
MDRRRIRAGIDIPDDPILSNMYDIMRLRRRVRELQQQSNELQQRMRLILSEWRQNSAENNELRMLTDGVERQIQVQDALNGSMEDEIMVLRMLIGRQQQTFDPNSDNSLASEIQQIDGNQNVSLELNPDNQVLRIEQNPDGQAVIGNMNNQDANEGHNSENQNVESEQNPENQPEAKE